MTGKVEIYSSSLHLNVCRCGRQLVTLNVTIQKSHVH